MIIILSHYFGSLNKWEARMQTVVIPTPFTWFGCKYPQIKADSLQLKHILFVSLESIVVVYRDKHVRIVSMSQYLWTWLYIFENLRNFSRITIKNILTNFVEFILRNVLTYFFRRFSWIRPQMLELLRNLEQRKPSLHISFDEFPAFVLLFCIMMKIMSKFKQTSNNVMIRK